MEASIPVSMEDVETTAAGSEKSKKSSEYDFDAKSGDFAVEYSQAKSFLCLATDDQEDGSKTPEELYQALSEKNQSIELLKRRLTNQQIQLGYYLHKNLTTEAVLEFSNKCIPQLAEDSTQLSLAMYKFIRDTGGKTRLAQLREKLSDYNNRVHKVLLRQEQLIRQGFGFDDADDIRRNDEVQIEEEEEDEHEQEQTDDFRFAKKYYKSAKLEMCSQLLAVTLQVRKELEQFRTCAENVVKLEEERNVLVDRVFSIPADQRFGNLRLSMVDTAHRRESATSLHSVTSVSTSANDGKPLFNNLEGVLSDMESEAIQLLLLSEKQKHEFVIALEEARVENEQLKERLCDLENAASDERVFQLQEKCINIEKEVEIMRKDLEAEQNEKEEIIQKMAAELDKRDLCDKNKRVEIKRLKATVELLRNERDNLQRKLEVTTRQYIRQMHQNTSTDDMLTTKSEVISQTDVEDLTDLVVLQEEKIKDLLSIMSEMNESETRSVSSRSTVEPPTTARRITEEKTEDSGVYARIGSKEDDRKSEDAVDEIEEHQIYYDSASEFSHQVSEDGRAESESPVPCESEDSEREQKNESRYNSPLPEEKKRRSRSRQRFFHEVSHQQIIKEARRSGLATTSLRVRAFDKDGKSESMHAVLECTSPVDGLLEMNNSSNLHLRLQCTSPIRHNEYVDSFPEKEISGDHRTPDVISFNQGSRALSREARIYLSKQLNKIKSRLDSSRSSSIIRKEIVENLNEIYSQLFGADDEVLTQSTNQS